MLGKVNLRILVILSPSLGALIVPTGAARAGGPLAVIAVPLGTTSDFAALAGTTITNTGSTVLNGELGLSPGASVTGFPPGTVNGAQHVNDAIAAQAQSDLTTAYDDAGGQAPTSPISGNLGGRSLNPGVYNSTSSLGLTGTVTLNGEGDANAVFVIQVGSALTTASESQVTLINDAQACDVFWQVGSSATLGTASSFTGSILAMTSITVTSGVMVTGQVLARNGAVTLDDDTITTSNCDAASATATGAQPITTGAEPSQPLTEPQVPAPPAAAGCYLDATTAWQRVSCATVSFTSRYLPHPEVLSDITAGLRLRSRHFAVSVVSAMPINNQAGSETDSQYGADAYSLQNNAYFVGSNGQDDVVQFTDQSSPLVGRKFFGGVNGLCIWQLVISTQRYVSKCIAVPFNQTIETIEGNAGHGMLTVAAAAPESGATSIAVVVRDIYGLGVGHRWNNSSGSILGYGTGSRVVFRNTEESISVEVASCLADAGFLKYSVSCDAKRLRGSTSISYSPGPKTLDYDTSESNNLIPVIGSPASHLPRPLRYFSNGFAAQITYAATTTGRCWTGQLPYCA